MRADPFAGIRDGYGDQRDQFPPRADMPPPRWCARCKRVHAGFAREDFDAIIAESARKLQDNIDTKAAEWAYHLLAQRG